MYSSCSSEVLLNKKINVVRGEESSLISTPVYFPTKI